MTRRWRTALLGAGIGAEHLTAYRSLTECFDVRLVVDRDTARAEDLRAAGDAFDVRPEIADALVDPDIDLIDICLPPHLHVPVALDALAAGKHVICEKPIACSLADLDRLEAALAATDRQLFPVFQYRYGPAMTALLALQEAGLTGQPVAASLETHWNRGADYYAVPWRGTWAGEQGGAILGHAIHIHDLATQLMGRVTRVTAQLGTRVNPIETEDTAALTFETEQGALITSSVTLGAASDTSRLRLIFRDLTAESGSDPYQPMQGGWTLTARNPDQQSRIDQVLRKVADGPSGFEGFLTDVANALDGQPHTAITLPEARLAVEVVTATYLAAREGRSVELPLRRDCGLYDSWLPTAP